jgi:predicted Zn-dependent protease
MAAKLLGHFGGFYEESSVRYVELVGNLIAARVGRPELRYRFAVLNCPEVNAYATPGGYVFVTKGLLKQIRSEAELAGILGHEIAHINERHMYRELRPNKEVSAGESIVRMLSRGGSTLGGSISKLVEAGMKTLLQDGLGAEKERQADEIGIMYAQSVGYSPQGLLSFLRRQQTGRRPAQAGKSPKGYAPWPERLEHMARYVRAQGLKEPTGPQQQVMNQRLQRSLSTLKDK